MLAPPASPRPAASAPSAVIFPRLPAARIPLVVGVWIEPASDPGHGAHLDPLQTLLDRVRRAFPATPFLLLVPPGIARTTWLPDLAAGRGCAVSVTEEIDGEAPDIVTLARHARVIRAAGWVSLAAGAWIRGLGEPDAKVTGTPVPGHLRCLREGWIAARRRVLEREASDRESRARRLRRIAVPAALAVLLSLAGWLAAHLLPSPIPAAGWWTAGTAAVGLLAALSGQLAARHGLEAQRLRRELRVLDDLATDLETAGPGLAMTRAILRLTDAALAEQADRAALETPGAA